MDSGPLASPAGAMPIGLLRRQLAGLSFLTPDELKAIDTSNQSTLASLVSAVGALAIAFLCFIVVLRLVVRRRTTGRLFIDDGEDSTVCVGWGCQCYAG